MNSHILHGRGPGVLALVVGVFAGVFACTAAPEAAPEQATTDAGACVVAEVGGQVLTLAEVERFRQHLEHAPEPGAATRFAVEAALARWAQAGTLDGATVAEQIDAHSRLLNRARDGGGGPRKIAERAQAELHAAAGRAGLKYGPCHAPPLHASNTR